MSYIETIKKIKSFIDFKNGCFFGEGIQFLNTTISKSVFITLILKDNGFTIEDAFPGFNGEIRITAHIEECYLEVTINNNQLITLIIDKNDVEFLYLENKKIEEFTDFIYLFNN